MDETYRLHIDGVWTDALGGGTRDVLDPATEEVVKTVPFGGAEDCAAAIDAAWRAFPSWSRATPNERAAVLKRTAERVRADVDTLAEVTTRECGKALREARLEWLSAADMFEWFAEEGRRAYGRTIPSARADKRMFVLKQPVGVVGIITAWNFPAYNPSRAWAAALAAGCTVVVKPSELTPLTAMNIARILAESGLPAGVSNVVNGDPDAIGRTMLEDERCRKLSFTGSVRVGRILMEGAARTFTRLSLELGGNAPVIVFPDVDLDDLARSAVRRKFRNSGQFCVAPQRFMIHEEIYERFLDRVVADVRELVVGNGLDPETHVGPLINRTQCDRIESMVEEAVASGADVRVGGAVPDGLDRGYFYLPTVVDRIPGVARLLNEEVFGPVLPARPFTEVDEAIALANATPYGLAAYVWTHDLGTAVRVWEGLEFGLVGVNDWAPQGIEAPFGGWKQSGMGRESGAEGLDAYLEPKLVGIGGLD